MSEQSEIDKAIPVGLWYGLTESQKRENLSCDGSDVSGLINDKVRSPEIAVMRIVKARNENEAVKKTIRKIDKRDRSRYRLYEVTEVMR